MTLADLIQGYHDAYAKSVPFVQAERAGMRRVVEMLRDEMERVESSTDAVVYGSDVLEDLLRGTPGSQTVSTHLVSTFDDLRQRLRSIDQPGSAAVVGVVYDLIDLVEAQSK